MFGIAGGVSAAAVSVGMLVLTRQLTPGDFGWLVLAMTVTTLITSFGTLGVSNGIQFFYLGRSSLSERFRLEVVTSGVVCAAVALIICAGFLMMAFALSSAFAAVPAAATVVVAGLGFTWGLGQVLQDLRRLRFQVRAFAATAGLRALAGTGLGILFVVGWGAGPIGYLQGLLLGSLAALALALWFARGDLRTWPTARAARTVLRFSWPLALAGGAAWVSSSASLWVLAWSGSAEEVGVYGLSLRFGALMTLLVASVSQAWSPRVLHAWSNDPGFIDLISRFSLIWSSILLAASSIATWASILLVQSVAGPAFAAAANVMPLVMLAFTAQGLVTFTAIGLTIAERTRTIGVLAWGSSLLCLALSVVLAPILSTWGVALASLTSQAALVVGYALASRRAAAVPLRYRGVVLPWILAAAVCAVTTLALVQQAGFVIVTLICFAAAGGFLSRALLIARSPERASTGWEGGSREREPADRAP